MAVVIGYGSDVVTDETYGKSLETNDPSVDFSHILKLNLLKNDLILNTDENNKIIHFDNLTSDYYIIQKHSMK